MAIEVDQSQALMLNGVPFDQCFFTLFAILRPCGTGDSPVPFAAKYEFYRAVKGENGYCTCVGNPFTGTITDIEALAISEYMAGRTDLAVGITAIQPALAALIACQRPNFSTAHYVQVP